VSTAELIESVERAGGVLKLDGEKLRCKLPKDALHLADLLREHKPELTEILKARGGRIANFPHCPNCASYALYRRNNIGNYECLTCGLPGIDESMARRRVQ
jgi:Zn ribbon nucleic-acid-binding protein